jgi:hypothetical protein
LLIVTNEFLILLSTSDSSYDVGTNLARSLRISNPYPVPEAGHRTLGFHMTGDGKSSAHKKVMKEKAVLFGEAIMGSSLWRSKSSVAYNSFYLPSLGYGMCATML